MKDADLKVYLTASPEVRAKRIAAREKDLLKMRWMKPGKETPLTTRAIYVYTE